MRLLSLLPPKQVKRSLTLAFLVATALVSLGYGLSFYSYWRTRQHTLWTTHTYEVITELNGILSLVKDVETSTRGFVATRDTLFLGPYRQARPRVQPRLSRLRQLIADNPTQQSAADTLARLVAAKIDISDRQILNTRRQLLDTDQQTYLRLGKVWMDQLRVHTARMITHEQTLLSHRRALADRTFQISLLITLLLFLLTLVILLAAGTVLNRELRRRAANEAQLRAYDEQLTEQIRQLETSNQELERFAFVASHDMQEPLRKILTFGELLRQHQPTGAESHTYLNKMLTSATRMSTLIRDLLSFSRLKNQSEAVEKLNLNEVVQRVLTDLELPIQASGATLSLGTLPTLEAVPSQMEQLFTNLIGNALKYRQPGISPRISLTAGPVEGHHYPGLNPAQVYQQLTLTDNGIGFDEKYLGHIFEVFQRLHPKAQYEGTGVGLAICQRVVANHHGYITARSREQAGTTFIVILPETQPAPPVPALPTAPLQPHQQYKEPF